MTDMIERAVADELSRANASLLEEVARLRARNEKLEGAGRAVLQKLRDWQAARQDEGPNQSPSYHEFIWLVERIEALGAALEDGE